MCSFYCITTVNGGFGGVRFTALPCSVNEGFGGVRLMHYHVL